MPGKNSVGKTKKNSSATPRQKKSKQNSQEPKQEQDRAQSPASPKEESGHWFSNEREQRIAALLPGIRKKKPEALAAFFEEFSDDIYNFPMRVFRLSEDEASEFYLYAFEHLRDGRKIASFQGKSRFTTWFYAVLRNLTIDFLRTQKDKLRAAAFLRTDSSGRVFDATEQLADAPEQELYEETLFAKFRTALTALPLQQRVLFKLAYAWYFELEPDEIDYLCNLHRQDTAQIVLRLQQLKTIAHERSVEVRELEERLTANFQGISILESK
ncbi:MAG: sigma-70 family RNA polymerase sigma factor, partial [Leptospiraceae bacterium]|nr:sigma-70 family RNA polymerase sigma factor [Leptospiraceae bacterium]